ncbi:actin cortical patch SUR7/pH-response regulator pali [Lipomyces oligophaga]|uniref:actin cortical patch SUR7/pH-response regulator pali n=1 Tax=Lipomyces oligophaga TaxID=45792 RepID=UPI0034CD2592
MAAGRNCFIITFPFLFTVSIFVLSVFVLISSTFKDSIAGKLYLLKLDISDLSVTIDGTTVNKSDISTLPDYYQVGLWTYCQGTREDLGSASETDSTYSYTLTNCSKSHGLFYFNPLTVLEDAIGMGSIEDYPSSIDTALKSVKILSYAMAILFCLSAIFAVFQFGAGLFSFHSRGGSCCAMIFSIINFVCALAAIAIATALFLAESKAFTNDTLNTTAELGKISIGLGWGAAAAALLSSVFWLFSICVGSTRSSVSEKVVYTPVENPVLPHQRF